MAGSYRQGSPKAIAALRVPVERSFAIVGGRYGYRRVRHRSLVRNALQLQVLAIALNLRRAWCSPPEGEICRCHRAIPLNAQVERWPPLQHAFLGPSGTNS